MSHTITERENVLRIITRSDEPQWVPFAADALDMGFPTEVLRERPTPQEGSGKDWFGCEWVFDPATRGFTPLPGHQVLSDITKWREEVVFPDLNKVDWEKAKEYASNFDRKNKVSNLMWESGPWERMHALLGFENTLVALYENPDEVLEFMDAITEFKISAVERIAEYYQPDIVTVLDDFGHQNAPFFSNDMFRKFIQPFDKKLGQAITDNGMIYAHHSCGTIDPLLDDMLDMNPKLLVSLYYPYNDGKAFAEKYGDRAAVLGGDFTQLLDNPATPDEEVVSEIKRLIDTLAPTKGLIVGTMSFDPHRMGLIAETVRTYGNDYWNRNSIN